MSGDLQTGCSVKMRTFECHLTTFPKTDAEKFERKRNKQRNQRALTGELSSGTESAGMRHGSLGSS